MNDPNQNPNQPSQPLFNEGAGALMPMSDQAGVARAVQEIQAALVIAQRFPRDEIRAKQKILQACQRKELAEVAEYEYSRGGTRITGPTIDLLRAVANRWGNIRFGWTEVERRDGSSFVRCFAWDLQTNGQAERTFSVKHWRDTQAGGYALEDERDIYELLANSAARRVRACLEEVIDSDIVTAAVDQCRETLRKGEKTPLKDRVVIMLNAFVGEFGVTKEMIEARLGNCLDAVSENQLASLRRIYKSLKDGVGRREDFFKPEVAKPVFNDDSNPDLGPQTPPNAPGQDAAPPTPAQTPTGPSPAAPMPAAANPSPAPLKEEEKTPLRWLRDLCRMATPKIKESTVLDYLSRNGTTDGSVTSLEELQLRYDLVVKALARDWSKHIDDIKAFQAAAQKGGEK